MQPLVPFQLKTREDNITHFPSSSRSDPMDSKQAHCVSFLFFWFNFHFLFLKQIFTSFCQSEDILRNKNILSYYLMDCLQSQGHRYLSGWRTGIARTLWWDGTEIPRLLLGPVLTGWNRTLVFKFFVSLCGEFFPFLHTQRKSTGCTCRESAT